MSDKVKNPSHYTQFKMQPIEFFRANIDSLDFMQMCAIKYICRYKAKNGVEDIDKAINFLQMMREDWLKRQGPQEKPKAPTIEEFEKERPGSCISSTGLYSSSTGLYSCSNCHKSGLRSDQAYVSLQGRFYCGPCWHIKSKPLY